MSITPPIFQRGEEVAVVGEDGRHIASPLRSAYNPSLRRTIMPLRDHFRSPVKDTHSWDEVHGGWPMEIVRDLVTILPAGFRAGPSVHLGSSLEVAVTTYESVAAPDADGGGTATQTALSPTLTVEADLSEQDE